MLPSMNIQRMLMLVNRVRLDYATAAEFDELSTFLGEHSDGEILAMMGACDAMAPLRRLVDEALPGVALTSMAHPYNMPWWRRLIIRAAPTCTLWRHSPLWDILYFAPWPRWQISRQEVMNA